MSKKFFMRTNNNFPFRIYLYYNIELISYYVNNVTENKFITDFSDIEKIVSFKEAKIIRFIYFNKDIIHKILYSSENIIRLNHEYIKSLKDYFYLDLLIIDNMNIINYYYSLELIKNLNYFIKSYINDNQTIKKIILSRISVDLLNNYKETQEYNFDKDEKILIEIEKNNIKMIQNNLEYLKNLNINYNKNDILSIKIDELYLIIIKRLFESNKFDDYEYITNIINQLDLESINITKTIYDGLSMILKEDFIKNYIILEINDLINIKKINFYYILLKYIFKDPVFMYQFPILLKTKKFIVNEIKNRLSHIWSIEEIDNLVFKQRISYIIKYFMDSEFYHRQYLNNIKLYNLSEILVYYKRFLFESKNEEIKLIEKLIKNRLYDSFENYSNDYKNAKKMNNRFPIIEFLFNSQNLSLTEYSINNYAKEWEIIENLIMQKKYQQIDLNNISMLISFLENNDNKDIFLKIFKKDNYKSFINGVTSLLKEKKAGLKNPTIKDIDEINSNKSLIIKAVDSINNIRKQSTESEIIKESYYIGSKTASKQSESLNVSISDIQNERGDIYKYTSIIKEVESNLFKMVTKSSIYKILEYVKIIEKIKNPHIITKLRNDCFIFGGDDKYFYVYNHLYEFLKKIPLDLTPNCIVEKFPTDNYMEIIICCLDKIFIFKFENNIDSYKIYKYEIVDGFICLSISKVGENSYSFFGNKGGIILNDVFLNRNLKQVNITKKSLLNTININENIIAFTSNSITYDGEDRIFFYDLEKNLIIKEIEGYSFIMSLNGLYLIYNEKMNPKNKILLCACKKYKSEQKNGILLININLENQTEVYNYFYDLNNYEVYCFCQIQIVSNSNPINGDISKKENIKTSYSDYFFVGGFDKDKRMGLIKLFRVIYSEKIENTQIEYLDDIIFENNNEFNGFDGPISNIYQSNIFGNILVACMDGNIYLFKPPNIDYFLQIN